MVEDIVGCKWSLQVLRHLEQGVNRPGQMQKQTPGLSTKVLNERLSKLMRYGLVDKVVHPVSPPRVEYHFTDFGQRFLRIIRAIEALEDDMSPRDNGGG
jgi:DNA-binding HxlR family transcriptional regulator